jgi:hypothetical protein
VPNLAVGLGVAVWLVVADDARSLPDPGLTPGAVNPAVTEATIDTTICVWGWTRTVRPPAGYTEELKRRQIREYGYADRRLRSYEEDHLVSLDLGGSPDDPRNLWPEPREAADGWNADRKDELEAVLARLVCAHQVLLREAQRAIATDWISAYRRFVGGP